MLWVKEPLNKSSAERVADKIGTITRRTTQVVAWSTMPRSAWRPKASPEGAPRSGDRAAAGAETARLHILWGARIPLPGRIPFVAFRAFHPAKPPSRPRGIYSEVP